MIVGLCWMVAAQAGVAAGARAILRRVRTGEPETDLTLFLIYRLALISIAVLVAGLVHGLQGWVLGCAGLAAAVLTFRDGLPTLRGAFGAGIPKPLMVFLAVVAIRLVLQVWIVAPHLGDAVSYHLPKVAEWVRAGAFTREMGTHSHVSFPAGFELIETWWVVFLRHDVLIEMAGVEFVVLAFAAVRALGRRLNLSPAGAALAAAFYVLTPGFHLSATSCLNDAPTAAAVVAVFALVAARAPLPALLLAGGMAVGIKPIAGFALPGVLLLALLMREGGGGPAGRRPAIAGAALAGSGVLLGGFWYARNLLWYGNPVYPLGEPGYVDPTPVQLGPVPASLLGNLLDLVNERLTDHHSPYGANADHIAAWGPVAFAPGLVALIPSLRDDPRFRALAAAFVLSLLGTLLFVQHDPWSLKYVFFFPALLCLAAARQFEQDPGFRGVALLALGYVTLATMFPYDLPRADAGRLWRQPWETRTAAELEPRMVLPGAADDTVGYFGGTLSRSYLLYRPDFSREVAYLRVETAEQLRKELAARRLRLLYAAPQTIRHRAVLEESVAAGTLTALGDGFFEVRPRP